MIEFRYLEKKVNKYENSGIHAKPERVLQYRCNGSTLICGIKTTKTEWQDVPIVKDK